MKFIFSLILLVTFSSAASAQTALDARVEIIQVGTFGILSGFKKPDEQVYRHVGRANAHTVTTVDARIITV